MAQSISWQMLVKNVVNKIQFTKPFVFLDKFHMLNGPCTFYYTDLYMTWYLCCTMYLCMKEVKFILSPIIVI